MSCSTLSARATPTPHTPSTTPALSIPPRVVVGSIGYPPPYASVPGLIYLFIENPKSTTNSQNIDKTFSVTKKSSKSKPYISIRRLGLLSLGLVSSLLDLSLLSICLSPSTSRHQNGKIPKTLENIDKTLGHQKKLKSSKLQIRLLARRTVRL